MMIGLFMGMMLAVLSNGRAGGTIEWGAAYKGPLVYHPGLDGSLIPKSPWER